MKGGEAICFTLGSILLMGAHGKVVEFSDEMRSLVLSTDGGDLADGNRVLGVSTSGAC